jgi:hypothetical protein
MVTSMFLREKAAQCRRLANVAINREIRDASDELARELEQQADAQEARHVRVADRQDRGG